MKKYKKFLNKKWNKMIHFKLPKIFGKNYVSKLLKKFKFKIFFNFATMILFYAEIYSKS